MGRTTVVIAMVASLTVAAAAPAQTLSVGAASDLQAVLPTLTQPFEQQSGNPEHAPYGRAAVAALRHEHRYEAVESTLVPGEHISQAAQFVQSGSADVGILALSVAPALKVGGTCTESSSTMHPPIRQAAVVLRDAKHQKAGRVLFAFLKQPDSMKLFADFGFAVKRD